MPQDQPRPEDVDLEFDLSEEEAEEVIAQAASARESLARRYVLRLLRRHPDATPAQITRMLEKHYSRSIMAAGWVVSAGARAAETGKAMIPGSGLVIGGAKRIGEHFVRKGAESALERWEDRLPAGEQQLQFELTALFALALADLHGVDLDEEQAKALVMGLANKKLKHKVLVRMTQDAAELSGAAGAPGTAWAMTLAEWIPGEHSARLQSSMKTGKLVLEGEKVPVVDYGLRIKEGDGISFAFGRAVVKATKDAFPEPPERVPVHLLLALAAQAEEDDGEGNRATEVMEDAAKVAGEWMVETAKALGDGVGAMAQFFGRRRGDDDEEPLEAEPGDARAAAAVGEDSGRAAGESPEVAASVTAESKEQDDDDDVSVMDRLGSFGGGLADRWRGRKRDKKERDDETPAEDGAS